METEVLSIPTPVGHEHEILRAAERLRRGELVVFPTETVYGIGGNATDAGAAKAIYAAKGRPSDNPLIIHVASPEEAEPYAVTSECYYRLARAFMPGPLTVILPRKSTVPLSVTGGLETVAVRCPAHPVANALIAAAGVPIAAPSANRSGKPSPTCATHVIEDLDGRVSMIIDGGECEFGLESTIVSLDGEDATLLRPGAITYDELCQVCRRVTVAPAVLEALSPDEKPLSPGMKYRHYAPSAPLTLVDGERDAVLSLLLERSRDKGVGILCYEEDLPLFDANTPLFSLGPRGDLNAQAKQLFAALRQADTHPALTQLYAPLPPKDGLGLALCNRILRAAAHNILKI